MPYKAKRKVFRQRRRVGERLKYAKTHDTSLAHSVEDAHQCKQNQKTCQFVELDHCYTLLSVDCKSVLSPKLSGTEEDIQDDCVPCIVTTIEKDDSNISLSALDESLHYSKDGKTLLPDVSVMEVQNITFPLSKDNPVSSTPLPSRTNDPVSTSVPPHGDMLSISSMVSTPKRYQSVGQEHTQESVVSCSSDGDFNLYHNTLPHGSPTLVDSSMQVANCGVLLDKVLANMHLMLPSSWVPVLKGGGIHVGLMASQEAFIIKRSLFVLPSGKISVLVHGLPLSSDHELWHLLKDVHLNPSSVGEFSDNIVTAVNKLRALEICCGVEDFEPLWKDAPNSVVDNNNFHEHRYYKCCRTKTCALLVKGFEIKRCVSCNKLQAALRERNRTKMKQSPSTPSEKKPHSMLNTPQRTRRLRRNSQTIKNLKSQNKRLQDRIQALLQNEGVDVDPELSADFSSVFNTASARSNLTPFQKMFISQQIKASTYDTACHVHSNGFCRSI